MMLRLFKKSFYKGFCSTPYQQRLFDNPKFIKNIAIIAHVDHGKTTLVDTLLKHSGCIEQQERAMDSNELEKEKGITILSKCTSIIHKDYKINIIDTPGHQDFGGEVERIMDMVDGVALVVCATEGPMTQTKFVLQKALAQKLRPMVVINKVDRPSARVQQVVNEIFDLFCTLEAPDEFLDYPIFYTSAKNGWAVKDMTEDKKDISCILDTVIDYIPSPKTEDKENFTMLVSQTEGHLYFGKTVIGKIYSGSIKTGERVSSISYNKELVENIKIMRILRKVGTTYYEIDQAFAGDIVQIAGFEKSTVSNTINTYGNQDVIPALPIDPPMISIHVYVNTSPVAGKEGQKFSFSDIKERFEKEAENDVSLRVIPQKGNCMEIQGRGDLHLSLIIEKFRREGYEMAVTPPQIVLKEENGKKLEPIEQMSIIVELDYISTLIEKMNQRRGEYQDCIEQGDNKQKLIFSVPIRGTIGLRSEIINETKGQAIITSQLIGYEEYRGDIKKSRKASLIANNDGVCTAYGIHQCERLGQMFVKPGQKIYKGMIIGEGINNQEIETNPAKEKRLTNVRSVMAEEQIRLIPPRQFEINEALAYICNDELIEVTPQAIRIRKIELDSGARKILKRRNQQAEVE